MDGRWTDGWMDCRAGGQMGGRMDEWTDGGRRTEGLKDSWSGGRTERWMDRRARGRMDRQTDGQFKVVIQFCAEGFLLLLLIRWVQMARPPPFPGPAPLELLPLASL